MKLHVHLFAAARQLAGGHEIVAVDCPEQPTVGDLRRALVQQCPALEPLLPHTRFAVNSTYAIETVRLQASDEIACIPPVSGG
jgi:molybdopterin converting factor small subunit